MHAAREVRGDFPLNRVLAIGDGMPTDVRGALNYGLDLLYISGGIHAKEYTLQRRDRRGDPARLSRTGKGSAEVVDAAPRMKSPKIEADDRFPPQ